MSADLAERIRARIAAEGPLLVSRFVDAALYDPTHGFYATGGQAGRRGDFLTAPEVGPLFGAVISNAIDTWWEQAGEPDRFVVAEHGAGPGTLARTVTVADGACRRAGALEWVMVEPSDPQRRSHPTGDHLRSVAVDVHEERVDVVLANELLDNLPFDIVAARPSGWIERRVDIAGDRFVLIDGGGVEPPPAASALPVGTELPVLSGAAAWIEQQRAARPDARMLVLDYAASTEDLAARNGGWLRSYRGHDRVADWLSSPGGHDITIDLATEQLASHFSRTESQAALLRRHGIDALVAEGRRLWTERSAIGDLAALRARSRIAEAEALLEPAGMGGFTAFEWVPAGG